MKRNITAIVCIILILVLNACSGNENKTSEVSTVEESVTEQVSSLNPETAIPETAEHIYKDATENQARAMQNTYLVKCIVGNVSGTYFDYKNLRICLPVEILATLNKGDSVGIIGRITDIEKTTTEYGLLVTENIKIVFGEAELYDGPIPEVGPRTDEIFKGIIVGEYHSTYGETGLYVRVNGTNYEAEVVFADGENIKAYSKGDSIVFSADIGQSSTTNGETRVGKYINAKIIKE